MASSSAPSNGRRPRVCLIGAGPSGMSILYHMESMRQQGKGANLPEIVCYEKQNNWGGLWNYTWRTGLDEYGEYVHNGQYRYLWSNGPKEALEFPDYTFEDHYGKAIPSFPPREVLFDYLQGRWNKMKLRRHINLEHVVRQVRYNADQDNFSVVVKNMAKDVVLPEQTFDYVLVCSGHFSIAHQPTYPGYDRFPGRILHSHDFRDAAEFAGQRILCIGASYSAEDLALQCIKYGAKNVICSYRSRPMGFNWPASISERPQLVRLDGKTAHFKDGSSAEVDVIVQCTGYLHSYPYLPDQLRLTGPNLLYPDNLYKGTLWVKGGNNRVLYVGAQDQYYTYTMFDVQALWAVKYLMGEIEVPGQEKMLEDIKKWRDGEKKLKDCHGHIDFQTEFVQDLAKEVGLEHDLDVADIFHAWEHDKDADILTYRDKSFTSKFTGTKSPIHHSTFMEALDDSIGCFMGDKK